MTDDSRIRAAMDDIEEKIRVTEALLVKLRSAVAALRAVMPPPVNPEPTNGTIPVQMNGRPLLRDAIPTVLREHGQSTILEIAQNLYVRGWLGGSAEKPSVETIRPILDSLRENGVVESEIPPGQKAAVWRLTNKLVASSRPAAIPLSAIGGDA